MDLSDNGAKPPPASEQVATFEIRCTRFLDAEGTVMHPLPDFARDPRNLIPLYRLIVLARVFDAKCIALQRTGQLGTYASGLGQEATMVTVGHTMRPEDVLLPSYREGAAQLARGVRMAEILLYWGGDERGSKFAVPTRDLPVCVTVATHAQHAVGVAYAMQYRGEPRVAVCIHGDGGTSKGDFYEAINFAGVRRLPVIFGVSNNQWAISTPRSAQSAAATLAQKAIAAGIDGEQVDGNDVVAVRDCMERALAKARSGGGPHLLEALTYRLGDHTTVDDAKRYRDEQEVERAWQFEPVKRLRQFLARDADWTDRDEEALQAESADRVERAVQDYLDTPAQPPEAMFDYLFETLPARLQAQRDEVARRRRHDG